MPKGDKSVLIYSNKFGRNNSWDMLDDLKREGYASKEEFVIDSQTVGFEDLKSDIVYSRLQEIIRTNAGSDIKVVMSGYSPLVALMLEAARKLKLVCVVFARGGTSGSYSEVII